MMVVQVSSSTLVTVPPTSIVPEVGISPGVSLSMVTSSGSTGSGGTVATAAGAAGRSRTLGVTRMRARRVATARRAGESDRGTTRRG